ncbi:MAG: molecular chaperone HtpG [Alphaproteobacteria bacterium]|nr:molecular chaperone HtpG [Alphaproteobacteria bacterium]
MTEERMSFQAEVSRLLDIVVHSLYSEKEIFLRELISNASDACDKLRYEALTQPELTGEDTDYSIIVTTDPKDRTITVSDNGIGMTRDELIANLGTIARSGTLDFVKKLNESNKPDVNIIGQFGVGFYASFMVAQMVEVVSRKAGSEESWCWRSDGKGDFAIEEDERSERGTSVTLYLKQGEDEFLKEDRLRAVINRYSDHIALPIMLNDDDKPANHASALWLRSRSDITPQQYKEFYHHVAHAFEDPAAVIHWKAEGKIEYTGLLFVPGMKPYDLFDPKRRHGVKLYVKRVFITVDAEGLVPPYLRFLRGVIDSEDLPLNVSRELLQHSPMLAKIRQGITRRVLGDLHKLANDEKAYAGFWENFGAVIKEGLYEDPGHRDELLKILRCRSTHGEGLISLAEYIARMKKGQESIYYINGDNVEALMRSPHLEGFKARGIEVLLLTDTVDDFWPMAVGEYEGKKLVSVTRAGQDLDKIAPVKTKTGEDKKEKAREHDLSSLIAMMKLVLGDKVKDVRASERLTESPVCLAASEGDIDIHLERFLKQHNQLKTATQRILEINPLHPLVHKMAKRAASEGAKANLEDAVWLLLDQARLLEGETIPDPSGFSRRLGEVLAKVV